MRKNWRGNSLSSSKTLKKNNWSDISEKILLKLGEEKVKNYEKNKFAKMRRI